MYIHKQFRKKIKTYISGVLNILVSFSSKDVIFITKQFWLRAIPAHFNYASLIKKKKWYSLRKELTF